MSDDRPALRRRLRAARRSIPADRQRAASHAVAARLDALLVPALEAVGGGVVAGYIATDGELDPAPCLRVVEDAGAAIALPRIDGDAMTFHHAGVGALVAGPAGLVQPDSSTPLVDPAELTLVLCPLVGFDAARNRLGRGRAYYDRAFAFLGPAVPRPRPPVLVGLAHDVQQTDRLLAEPHDVGLDMVITPTQVLGDHEAVVAALAGWRR